MKKKNLKTGIEVFPNKFKEIKNSSLRIGFGENFNKYGTITPGFLFAKLRNQFLVRFIIKTMNFHSDLIYLHPEDIDRYKKPGNKYLWFDNTDANLLGDFIVVPDRLNKLVVRHSGKECRAVVAIVPRLYKLKINNQFQTIFLSFIITAIIFLWIYGLKILQITNEFSGTFYVFRILVGQTIKKLPKKITGRIMYMTIIILSTFILNNFYSGVVDMNVGQEEIEFKSFEDLDNSGLSLYTPFDYPEYVYTASDALVMKNLKKKTKRMKNCISF